MGGDFLPLGPNIKEWKGYARKLIREGAPLYIGVLEKGELC